MSSTQHLTDNDGGERDDQLVFDRRIRLSIYYRFCTCSSVLIGDLTFSFFCLSCDVLPRRVDTLMDSSYPRDNRLLTAAGPF
jgi:hypothetical protein